MTRWSSNPAAARGTPPSESRRASVRQRGAEAFNQIPETASIGGTYRAHSTEVMKFLEQRMREVAEHTAAAFNLKAEATFGNYLSPTINHEAEVQLAAPPLVSHATSPSSAFDAL